MKRWIIAAALIALSLSASAFQPRTGHWNNITAESGRGFNIDIQDGVMVLTMYAYDQNGNAQWYIASGNMSNGQRSFTGTLDKFVNGQCNQCGPQAPQSAGNDGVISVAFDTEISATVTLPGGRTTRITPFNFKYGDPPGGMLGSWVFTEQIGAVGFADAYTFNHTVNVSLANTNGLMVMNAANTTGCVYEIAGTLAGTLVCAHNFSSGGTEGYGFRFGLDETYSGLYLSTSGTAYPMKGMRTGSASGFTKSLDKPSDRADLKSMVEDPTAPMASGELMGVIRDLAERLKEPSALTQP